MTVYNRTAARAEPLVAKGAKAAAEPGEACGGDTVVTMLSDDRAEESVVYGENGILKNLADGAVHISGSTISVHMSERLTAAHASAGQRFVAAPVFGRPDMAAAGKLFVIATGDRDAVEASRPAFDAVGQKTFIVSETPKAANLVKLSGNFLICSVIESLGEAFALVGKGGVDRAHYLDMLTSTLFGAPIYRNYGRMILNEEFEPAGFGATLGQKDMRLTLAAAEELSVPLPLASLLRDRFITLMAHGGEKLDWSAIGRLAAVEAGEAEF